MHPLVKDITGQKFGHLFVIEHMGSDKRGKAQWRCLCDCGNETIVTGNYLRSGHTKSCGCGNFSMTGKGPRKKRLPLGHPELNAWFSRYKRSANIRDLVFELTKEEFENITKKNCFYCNAPPTEHRRISKDSVAYIGNGIDRVNNSKGYIIDNVVPCCKRCNYMKSNISIAEFLIQIARIYKHLELD